MDAVTELRFRITFATPFRVSAGAGAPGVNATIDRDDPLPASSLKGVVRATAGQLGVRSEVIDEVFGSRAREAPWQWSAARALDGWSPPQIAARVALDEHHTAAHDMLALAEQTYAAAAEFTITQTAPCRAPDHDPPGAHRLHVAVLAVAAQATRSLGAARRRGLGWVQIRSLDPDITDDHVALVLGAHA